MANRVAGRFAALAIPTVVGALIASIHLSVGLAIIAAVGIAAVAEHAWHSASTVSARRRIVPILMLVVGLALASGGLIWLVVRTNAASATQATIKPKKPAAISSPIVSTPSSAPDPVSYSSTATRAFHEGLGAYVGEVTRPKTINLYVECFAAVSPRVVPEGGHLSANILNYIPALGEKLILGSAGWRYSKPAGSDTELPIEGFNYANCKVTNYTDDVLTNVILAFDISVLPKAADGGYGQLLKFTERAEFVIPRIEPGSKNPGVLWIQNQSQAGMGLRMRPEARTTRLGEKSGASVVLTIEQGSGNVLLLPVERK